jgi:putative aldouronate transport system substrate-binding protein
MNRKVLAMVVALSVLAAGLLFATGQEEGMAEEGPMPIEVMFWDVPNGTQVDDEGDDPLTNGLEERFDVDIQWVTSDSFQESLRLRIASGDYPDFFQSRDYGDYAIMYEDGLTHNISDYVEELALPHLAEYLKRDDIQILKEDDGWHMVPRWVGPMSHSMYVRQDWVEAAGVEMPPMDQPQTMDEFRDMLEAIHEADPDGTDTSGLLAFSWWWMNHIPMAFTGVYQWGTYNGEVIHQYVHPGYREGLQFLADLYADGLLDPEMATVNRSRSEEKFQNGKGSVILGHTSAAYRDNVLEAPAKERYPNADVRLLLWPEGPAGPRLKGRIPFFGSNMFDPEADDALIARVLEMMDFAFTDEGIDYFWFGIEGEHHVMENGERVKRSEEMTEMIGNSEGQWGIMVNGQYPRRKYDTDPEMVMAFEHNAQYQVVNPLESWTGTTMSELNAQVGEIHERWWFEFVLGDRSLDSDWDTYVQELNDAGLEELTQLAAEEMGM